MLFTIDFETFSRASLKKSGVHVYARHPSTRIICLAYGAGKDRIELWTPKDPPPNALLDHIYGGCLIEAHNVQFERAIWESICVGVMGWPRIEPEQWRCTMAAASRLALPRGLEDVARVLGLSEQKDVGAGSDALKKLMKPNKKGEVNEDPELLKIVYEYCKQDVRTEIALSDAMEDMPESELRLWQLDQTINERGLLIDTKALRHAMVVVDKCQTLGVEKLFAVADGEVTAVTQTDRVRKWIGQRLPEGAPAKLDKTVVENLLKRDDLPSEVRSMLILRQQGAKSSLGKLQAMVDRMNGDGRVRGNQIYFGAATGRWAGSGLQIQNFPRPVLKQHDVDFILDELLPAEDPKIIEAFYGDVPAAISSCLRGLIRAEGGSSLYVCDFAAIEARVLAWMAGQSDLVQAFVDGTDVYKYMANKIFDVPVDEIDKDQRFLGKSAVLGCLAGNTEVLTNSGWKHLVDITLEDKIWDGVEWVDHEGVIYQGEKQTLTYEGLTATPDHMFLLPSGWRPWSEVVASPQNIKMATEIMSPAMSNSLAPQSTEKSTDKRCVYDLLNAGPRHRFTIRTANKEVLISKNCGYSMGYRKFIQSCLTVGKVVVPSLTAKKTVKAYRESNPKIVQLWRDCNRECMECIKTGELTEINEYLSVDMHRGMMRIQLPSGRHLHYHSPRIMKVPAPWTQLYVGKIWMPENKREQLEQADVEVGDFVDDHFEGVKITPKMAKYLKAKSVRMELEKPKEEVIDQITFWGVDSQTKRWSKKRTYGGSLTENIVQAISRDLLAEAMLRVEDAGYLIIATIHDEIVAEVMDGLGSLEEYESLMCQVPDWASGCPIGVEGYVSQRYRK